MEYIQANIVAQDISPPSPSTIAGVSHGCWSGRVGGHLTFGALSWISLSGTNNQKYGILVETFVLFWIYSSESWLLSVVLDGLVVFPKRDE